ncbi:YrdB family protein [Streptomyces sp. NPDC046557]|uniref:YrdB family protein n=1 Tax=Streptomyces sp. NPDC046557 TaxID=3155372 RepID=UPI00340EBBE5
MSERKPAGTAYGGRPWFTANEGLAFLVEIVALAVLAWWGYRTGGGGVTGGLLAAGTLAVTIAPWGLFAAPKARFPLPLAGVLTVKALVLGGSAAALYALDHHTAALLWAAVVVANTAVAETLRRRR